MVYFYIISGYIKLQQRCLPSVCQKGLTCMPVSIVHSYGDIYSNPVKKRLFIDSRYTIRQFMTISFRQ